MRAQKYGIIQTVVLQGILQKVKNMSRNKIVAVASAAFFSMALAASAGIVYPSEVSSQWFSVITASLPDGELSGAVWATPTNGEAEVSGGKIQLDTDVTDPLKYTPAAASGPVAVVNATFVIVPNATAPDVADLADAQAALTVVTNATDGNLEWYGLAKVSGSVAWVPLFGNCPESGVEYAAQIVVDNGAATKSIRYAVKLANDVGEAVVLTNSSGAAWLENPQNTNAVTAVAFAGSGALGDFSGDNLLNDGATVVLNPEEAGFDFTNGTVKAVVTIPSDNPSGTTRTAVLTVVNFDNGTTQTFEAQNVTSGETISWDLTSLTPGGTYSYTVTVKSGTTVREVKSGTFTAANWSSDCWFGVGDSSAEAVTNGTFTGATFDSNKWSVESEAAFDVDDIAPGSNAVSRVDTRYAFESFIDAESLERLDNDVVGGIVAVGDGGGAWYAYTGVNSPESGWQALAGGPVPEANEEYVVRAEFDFMSPTHRVRYLVSTDSGATFDPLALNGNEWISLVSQTPGSLSSVGMTGKGYVKSICSKVAEKAVAESNGVKYNTLWEALRYGNGTVTLLTNATLKPSDISAGKFGPYTINVNGYSVVFDKSNLTGNWRFVEKDGKWWLILRGTVYVFF